MENSAMSLTDQYYVDPTNYQMPDFEQFYNQYNRDHSSGWIDDNPFGIVGNISEWFSGSRSRAMEEYNRQKELKQNAYEEAKLASARRYQEHLESTKYQRMSEDLKAAGLNPWLALQSGLGAASVSAAPGASRTNARYVSDHARSKSSGEDFISGIVTSAVKMLLAAAIFFG